ncbi:hypothetical protein IB223_17760 [Pseudoxanthomonas sp. PXM03]|uniref:hypothetical protein n=1 Tax=Pseudoxanthomonas sp. PXM03 TaxID=2769284 RepID=UPI00177B8AB2|nr:hypothetical protein [Pseudoxanthomonas sp. PXM03]MBD9437949.1 hypothetical protein [Pseudoxanthomonas sp. PXM03]
MSDPTEKKLSQALQRLIEGSPTHPKVRAKLEKRQAEGEPYGMVSFSNVALEAGVSRTLIGHVDCAYPKVRNAILKAKKASPAAETVRALRREIAELKNTQAQLITVCASLRAELDRAKARLVDLGDDPTVKRMGVNFRARPPKKPNA